LNDNGSIVFEGNNIYNFKQNSFPLCSINSFNNSIININKLNKFNTSIIYDVFKVKTPIPTSAIRQHATSSNINNILYIICGTALTSRNDAYNTNLDLWTTKANSLYSAFTLSSSTHLTNISMMGGYTTVVLNRNTLYNETLDSWENKTNMLVGRYRLSQTTHLSNIYSMFGTTSVSTNTNHKYDINIDSWSSTLTQAPNVNSFTSTVTYQNSIYAICGLEFIGSLNYNIITDIWGVKSTKPTRSFNGACNIINNNYILYIGGALTTNINSGSKNIEVYSILNDTWYTYYKTSLFVLYVHTASCVVDNNIFIINYYSNPTTQVYTPPKLL
jgi:hypothetical protein